MFGAGHEFSEPLIGYFISSLGVIFGLSAVWSIWKEIMRETVDNIREKEIARTKPLIELSHALRGLSNGQTEFVAKQAYIHVEGATLGDQGILWRVNFPGGTVPLEFIEVFLESSMHTAPYSHPVRDHQNPIFRDFTNVEEMLSVVTNGFIYKGWLLKNEGPYPAKLAPGESFPKIGKRFGLYIE